MTRTILLGEIGAEVRKVTPNGAGYAVRLGGNVWAISTGVHTLTIDGGQQVTDSPAELLICRNGTEELRAEIHTAAEAATLLATIPEVATYGELPELHAIRTTETPIERAILANFLIAAAWADARGSDGEQVTSSIDEDDITADDETWLKVRTMIRAFLAELNPREDERATLTQGIRAEARRIVEHNPEQAGHDLWLTMGHHGAGFWDRGYGEVGALLTEIAQRLGSEDASVEVDMPAAEFDALDTSDLLPTITLHYPA